MYLRLISVSILKASPIGKPGGGLRRTLFLVALVSLGFLGGCVSPGERSVKVKDTSRTFRTVVIDAGHGGHDTGTQARWAGKEKDAALDVALRLEPKLRAAGFNTVMTRKTDTFISLGGRTDMSNRQSNSIFVAVHFNEAKRRDVHGAETYYKSPASRALATQILRNVGAIPGTATRGVRTANFHVLRLNQYPAVLVECGYFSSPQEGARCATAAYRDALAGAIADGVYWQRYGAARPKK